MRVFIVSLVILLLIIAGIVCNTLYMDNLTNDMLDIILHLPETNDPYSDFSGIDDLRQLWYANIHLIAINTSSQYINDINTAIIDAEHFFHSDSPHLYKSARDKLFQAVFRLHELERFCIDNII